MKQFTLLNSDNGFIVQEVDARNCSYCNTAFIYKDVYRYYLVDKDSGLTITRSLRLKDLKDEFEKIKSTYESYRKTDAYQIKVERFNKLKLMHNYKERK